jgi:hypothetical protein
MCAAVELRVSGELASCLALTWKLSIARLERTAACTKGIRFGTILEMLIIGVTLYCQRNKEDTHRVNSIKPPHSMPSKNNVPPRVPDHSFVNAVSPCSAPPLPGLPLTPADPPPSASSRRRPISCFLNHHRKSWPCPCFISPHL